MSPDEDIKEARRVVAQMHAKLAQNAEELAGHLNKLLGTRLIGSAQVQVVADQMQKGIVAHERFGTKDRVGVTARLSLFRPARSVIYTNQS